MEHLLSLIKYWSVMFWVQSPMMVGLLPRLWMMKSGVPSFSHSGLDSQSVLSYPILFFFFSDGGGENFCALSMTIGHSCLEWVKILSTLGWVQQAHVSSLLRSMWLLQTTCKTQPTHSILKPLSSYLCKAIEGQRGPGLGWECLGDSHDIQLSKR